MVFTGSFLVRSRKTFKQTVLGMSGVVGYYRLGESNPLGPFANQITGPTALPAMQPVGGISVSQVGGLPLDNNAAIYADGANGTYLKINNNANMNSASWTVGGLFNDMNNAIASLYIQKGFGIWRWWKNSSQQQKVDGASAASRMTVTDFTKKVKSNNMALRFLSHDAVTHTTTLYEGNQILWQVANSTTNEPDNTQQDTGTGFLSIGQAGSSTTIKGLVDELVFMNRAITLGEVEALHTSISAPAVNLEEIFNNDVFLNPSDSLVRRILNVVKQSATWRYSEGVPVEFGEYGIPNDNWTYLLDSGVGTQNSGPGSLNDYPLWASALGQWLTGCDLCEISRFIWDIGSFRQYGLAPYWASANVSLDTVKAQASIIEAHPSGESFVSGASISNAALGAPGVQGSGVTGSFSNNNPGVNGTNYRWETASSLGNFLQTRRALGGPSQLRLSARWERFVLSLGGAVRAQEQTDMLATINALGALGFSICLEFHNYGVFNKYNGVNGTERHLDNTDGEFTAANLDSLYTLVNTGILSNKYVSSIEIVCNEPSNALFAWPSAAAYDVYAQRYVDLFRNTLNYNKVLKLAPWDYSKADNFPVKYPRHTIRDPLKNLILTLHQYFDGTPGGASNRTGNYKYPYSSGVALAQSEGYP